jgi:hypothetical protein
LTRPARDARLAAPALKAPHPISWSSRVHDAAYLRHVCGIYSDAAYTVFI